MEKHQRTLKDIKRHQKTSIYLKEEKHWHPNEVHTCAKYRRTFRLMRQLCFNGGIKLKSPQKHSDYIKRHQFHHIEEKYGHPNEVHTRRKVQKNIQINETNMLQRWHRRCLTS